MLNNRYRDALTIIEITLLIIFNYADRLITANYNNHECDCNTIVISKCNTTIYGAIYASCSNIEQSKQ